MRGWNCFHQPLLKFFVLLEIIMKGTFQHKSIESEEGSLNEKQTYWTPYKRKDEKFPLLYTIEVIEENGV